MHIFVTGATGFIGRAVVDELLTAGHTVTGLARSDEAAASLTAKGARVLRGSFLDLEIIKQGALESDGVINLAFDHDFSKYEQNCLDEKATIEALGSVLIGTNKPLITTTGTLGLTLGKVSTEDEVVDYDGPMNIRLRNEKVVTRLAEQNVRACVIRLAPTVHGDEDRGFVHMLAALAHSQGNAIYIDKGLNRWPAVHRHDAARLYRLAVEKGVAGSIYHGVAEEGVALRDIAEAIGQNLDLPVVSKSLEEMRSVDGFTAMLMSADNPTSSKKTQELLGWEPVGPKLLDDIRAGVYAQK
jgi:nucleoside-diphosphate-sugar epimerase